MIPADLLPLLRCPESGQGVEWAGPEILTPLNARISQGSLGPDGVHTLTGVAVEQPLTAALLRLDRRMLYPVRDGIPVLLAEEAIRL